MTPDERREKLRRGMDRMWNQGEADVFGELFAEHCSFHDPTFPTSGPGELRRQISELRTACPDLHVDVHDVVVEGDLSAMRWTMGGTARHDFRGIPGTGKSWVMTGMGWDKWEGDRIVESWVNYDMLGTLQQLGVIPETATQETAG